MFYQHCASLQWATEAQGGSDLSSCQSTSSVTNATGKYNVLLLFTGICRTLPQHTHSTHTHLSAQMMLLNLSRTSCSDVRVLSAFVCSVWRTFMPHFSYEPSVVLTLSATWLLFALFNFLLFYHWSLFSCKGSGYSELLGTVRSRSAKNKWLTLSLDLRSSAFLVKKTPNVFSDTDSLQNATVCADLKTFSSSIVKLICVLTVSYANHVI